MARLASRQIPSDNVARGNEERSRAIVVRAAIAVLGCVLVSLGVWLLASESMRPAASARDEANALRAARLGLVRGDLWLQAALSAPPEIHDGKSSSPDDVARVRAAAVKAVRLAPHESHGWLILAATGVDAGQSIELKAAALKMSYYTGANEIALIPLRISIAVQPAMIGDPELRSLVDSEIRMIARDPKLIPVLAAAYRRTGTDGRQALQDIVSSIDARLLDEMRRGAT